MKSETKTTKDGYKYEVIKPPEDLKGKAISSSGAGSDFGFDIAAIKRAEKALDGLSENFTDWMNIELDKLDEARQLIKKNNFSTETVEQLHNVAHDLKGQASTFGYPMATEFCAALCLLIETIPDINRLPITLIDQYVDAVRAVVREKVTDTEDEKSNKVLQELRKVTAEFVTQEIRLAKNA